MNAPPKPVVVPVEVQGATAQAMPAESPAPNESKQGNEAATQAVRGLRLEPQPDTVPAPRSDSVVRTLWALFGMAVLLALGALTQWHRHRRPRPAL